MDRLPLKDQTSLSYLLEEMQYLKNSSNGEKQMDLLGQPYLIRSACVLLLGPVCLLLNCSLQACSILYPREGLVIMGRVTLEGLKNLLESKII